MKTETKNTVLTCQIDLLSHHVRQPQIVETQPARKMWLIMAEVPRDCYSESGPFVYIIARFRLLVLILTGGRIKVRGVERYSLDIELDCINAVGNSMNVPVHHRTRHTGAIQHIL